MSKGPVCGRTGLVGKEHEIIGSRAVTVYKCHGCDHSWRVADHEAMSAPPAPLERAQAAARKRSGKSTAATPVRAPRMVIMSVDRAESYQPHGAEVCISITDPKAPAARLSPEFKAVLRLGFSDIAEPSPFAWHVLFAPEHAQEILDFVDGWPEVERIVIHCVGGQSRSPAVGMGLCDLKGWPLERMEDEHPLWNTWVRSELVRIGRGRKAPRKTSAAKKKARSAR
jgi:predicted protein tyrosine phosphatase